MWMSKLSVGYRRKNRPVPTGGRGWHAFLREKERRGIVKFTPYLNFDGDCAGAFTFYAEVFGGTAEVMTIGDSPVAGEVPADWHDRVMHASLAVGDQMLLGSDARPGEYQRPHSIYVAVRIGDADEAERVFHALAEGGTVTMPMGETF